MGATVAFEMTRILLQMGRDVERTILIDHYPRVLKNSMPSDGELVKRFASGVTLPLPTDLDWDQPDPHIMLEKIFQMAMDAKVLPPGVNLKQLIRLFQVYRAHVVALRHYQPLPLAAPFVLLYAQDSEFQPDCQNLNHLTPNLTLHALAGNHSTLFNKEHVAELANLMCQLTATKTLQQSKDLSDKDPS
jgi:thioesterase domain-containing protein